VRGYRIELGEIDTALEKWDGVRDAIVMVHDDCLEAFVVAPTSSPSSSEIIDEDTIKASLTDTSMLTDYMTPWRIVIMGNNNRFNVIKVNYK